MIVKLKTICKICYFVPLVSIAMPQAYAQANDTGAALYNVGLGAITSAVGALVNKKPNEKAGKVILKGLYQGALGGYATFESKRVLREASKNGDWKLFWTSKLINAAGNSVKENAANNINFWERWYFPIGFNRIEIETKDKFSVHYKISPIAAVYTIDAFFRFKFDANTSLKIGQLSFKENNVNSNRYAFAISGSYITFNDGISSSYSSHQKEAHEIIHMYQGEDFLFVNSLYHKPLNKLIDKYNTLQKINKLIYWDFHLIPLRAAYGIEYYTAPSYYGNFFEHEAGYYSNTLY